jgi:hypothetical protein
VRSGRHACRQQNQDLFVYLVVSCYSLLVVMVIFSVVMIYILSADGECQNAKWPRQIKAHFSCK